MHLHMQKNKIPKKREKLVFLLLRAQDQNFAQLLKKKISLVNTATKNKVLEITKIYPKTRDVVLEKENDLVSSSFQKKESPRKLAIAFQNKIKDNRYSWPQSNKSRP